MAKNAKNRHHRARLMAEFQRVQRPERKETRAVNHDKWVYKAARMYIKTKRSCSCYMCRSGRSKYGNGKAAKTFKELESLLTLAEGLLE